MVDSRHGPGAQARRDVVLSENMFLPHRRAAQLTGSIGMPPPPGGRQPAGSRADPRLGAAIAGQDVASPLAAIWRGPCSATRSARGAQEVEAAVAAVLDQGPHRPVTSGQLGTRAMGEKVIEEIEA